MTADSELKPCPWCGCEVKIVESLKEWIKCPNTDCYSWAHLWVLPPTEYRRQVIEKWNTRAAMKGEE